MAPLRTISLFTGAGGLDLGFHAAGFENAVAVEMSPVALKTRRHKANAWRWGAVLGCDLHTLLDERPRGARTAARLLGEAQLREGEADVLVGGPPCQPFSKSGYWASGDARRLEDPRASTLEAYLDVLETALPRVFLLENVPGLAFSSKDEGLQFLRRRIEAINRERGVHYSFCAAQLNAAAHGVPQLRERVFIVGHREGATFRFPEPTHRLPPPVDMSSGAPDAWVAPSDGTLKPAATAWDAIGHLQEDDDPRLLPRGRWAPVLATIPEGANYLWHTPRGGGLPIWGWRTRFWSMLLKIAKSRPSWTLTAQPGPAIGPFHWRSRRFSTDELKGLQTFPADYLVVGNVAEAHLQLGNAVPAALSEVLARQIAVQLFGLQVDATPTLAPGVRTPVPPPEIPASPNGLPPEILREVGHKAAHPGTGLGPGAMA